MEYIGRLYGKLGGIYFDTGKTSEDYDHLEANTDLQRLYDWLLEENREPAQTKFTAGLLRNVAKEIEYQIKSDCTSFKPQSNYESNYCSDCGNHKSEHNVKNK